MNIFESIIYTALTKSYAIFYLYAEDLLVIKIVTVIIKINSRKQGLIKNELDCKNALFFIIFFYKRRDKKVCMLCLLTWNPKF